MGELIQIKKWRNGGHVVLVDIIVPIYASL
jgi:hypothetical protein